VMDDVVFWDAYKWYLHFGPFGWWHSHYLAMADTTGAGQTWNNTPMGERVPFNMASPDARFPSCTDAKPSTVASNNPAPGHCSQGKYVGYRVSDRSQAARGQQQWSNYRDFRYYNYTYGVGGPTWAVPEITQREMKLLKAEALIRLGRAGEAVPIINETRVANNLPPVTATGVPNNPSSCVPRMPNGTCGNLLEALKWEKRVEMWGHSLGDWFFDSRGWGDLRPGTPLQWPAPAQDLEAAGIPNYTFGGVGGACAAGNPTGCMPAAGGSPAMLPADLQEFSTGRTTSSRPRAGQDFPR
jgi:hypothetical protein